MPTVCENYSGVVINQNHKEPSSLSATEAFYQTFVLPNEYTRGSTLAEERYPNLSGFQLQVGIASGKASEASISYSLEREVLGSGWVKLISGETKGCHAEGQKVWFDVHFPKEVEVVKEMVTGGLSELRLSFKGTNIEKFYYSNGNPYPWGKALNSKEESLTSEKASFNFRILALSADSGTDYLGNPYRSVVVKSTVASTSTTNGQNSGYWMSKPQPSRFAVTSYYADLRPLPLVPKYEIIGGKPVLVPGSTEEKPVVVDSVLIDPITPGVAFSIYYSEDLKGSETSEPTTQQWEEKLWTRVPHTYITSKRETFVLPEPITAKFIKIEFSYLQSKTYNAGDFQIPTTYKKFPDWVSYAFISATKTPDFVAQKVAIVYDALEFAYSYFLGDTIQKPEIPAVEGKASSQVALNQADPRVLQKINLELNSFSNPPGSLGDPETMIGSFATQNTQVNYPVEETPEFKGIVKSGVSGLNREGIVFDQSMPIMYFYLTCRHQYKELMATFENERAYFAGINEIAFLRNKYTTSSDGEVYIETGNDGVNTERNDFILDTEGNWHTY